MDVKKLYEQSHNRPTTEADVAYWPDGAPSIPEGFELSGEFDVPINFTKSTHYLSIRGRAFGELQYQPMKRFGLNKVRRVVGQKACWDRSPVAIGDYFSTIDPSELVKQGRVLTPMGLCQNTCREGFEGVWRIWWEPIYDE
jgi:hypothetical protein